MLFEGIAIDTPKKKVKPNEGSTLGDSTEHKLVKMSIMNKLLRGSLRGRKDTPHSHHIVSQFELPFESVPSNSDKDEEDHEIPGWEEEAVEGLQLGRRLTYVHQGPIEESLNTLTLCT